MDDQSGVTLLELLVAMLTAAVVTLAALAILQLTTEDTSRITQRAHVDQTGRVALQKIMLNLHSACVALEVNPILEGSTASVAKFVSESGNSPAFTTVKEHVITYTPASGKTEGFLTEQTFQSTGPETSTGTYPFSVTASSTTKLLTNVRQTGSTPIFRYYRYYEKGDTGAVYGELNPNLLLGTGAKQELSKTEAESVVKMTIAFTLAPEGSESVIAKGYQPVALEDSALFRLAAPSTSSEHANSPCGEAP